MPPLSDEEIAVFIDMGFFCFHTAGKFTFRHDKIQLNENLLVVLDVVEMLRHAGRKLCQNPRDFRFFGHLQFSQFVVQVYDDLGFHKEGRPGLGLVVDDARKPGPMLLLDRYDISAVPHSHDGILQISPIIR